MQYRGYALDITIFEVSVTSDESEFYRFILDYLCSIGATFYQVAPFPPPIDPNPHSRICQNGRFIGGIEFTHDLINPKSDNFWIREGAMGSYSICGHDFSFTVGCTGYSERDVVNLEDEIQRLAESRVVFLRRLIQDLKPKFAYVDHTFGSPITDARLASLEIRHLFWTSYYGPQFISKYGLEFFLNVPAWRVEEIGEGVLITVTPQFLTFANEAPKDTLKYMQQKFKGMRANRFAIPKSF
jgi:hypothetical protein